MSGPSNLRRASCCAALTTALLLGAAAARGAAQTDGDDRAAIARQRAAAEATFTTRDAECRRRFVVSSCLEDARRERRETLDALRTRQLVADEGRRRARVEARRAELAARASEDAGREHDRTVKSTRPGSSAHSASSAAAASSATEGRRLESRGEGQAEVARDRSKPRERPGAASATAATTRPKHEATAAQRRAAESSKVAAFEARKAEAARHREDVLDATTRRMLQRSPAPSLPVPSAPALKGASGP